METCKVETKICIIRIVNQIISKVKTKIIFRKVKTQNLNEKINIFRLKF